MPTQSKPPQTTHSQPFKRNALRCCSLVVDVDTFCANRVFCYIEGAMHSLCGRTDVTFKIRKAACMFSRRGSRIFCRGGGGGVNDGRVQRAPSAPAPTGGSRVDKHLKVHSVHRIFRAIFFFFFAIVKKFVEKKIGGREQGGGPPPRIRACSG